MLWPEIKWSCDPNPYYFPLVCPLLRQISWLIWAFRPLMKASWPPAPRMKQWAHWLPPIHLWFVPIFLSLLFHSFIVLLVHTSTSDRSPSSQALLFLAGRRIGYEPARFLFFKQFDDSLAPHIILGHRCLKLQESAECRSASSDSAAGFTSGTLPHTHDCCRTQTHTMQRSAVDSNSSHLLPVSHPVGCAKQVNLDWNCGCFYWLKRNLLHVLFHLLPKPE